MIIVSPKQGQAEITWALKVKDLSIGEGPMVRAVGWIASPLFP